MRRALKAAVGGQRDLGKVDCFGYADLRIGLSTALRPPGCRDAAPEAAKVFPAEPPANGAAWLVRVLFALLLMRLRVLFGDLHVICRSVGC